MKIARKYFPPISLLLISTLSVAYAATNLFTQTFPAISAAEGITVNCTTLTSNLASVGVGSSGFVAFDCSGTSPFGTTSAFDISTPGGTIPVTPQFTLPTIYTGLALIKDTSCGSGTGFQLSTTTAFDISTASFRYCAQYNNAPSNGLPTFSITWTTPTTPFTQSFPATPGATAITNNCATLTAFDNSNTQHSFGSRMTSIAIGSSGAAYFDCSGSSAEGSTAAFSVVVGPGGSVSFTPQFTLAGPYVAVVLVGVHDLCSAGAITGHPEDIITSGTPFTFTVSRTWAYCVVFNNAASTGLPSFDVTWTT